MKIAVIGGGAMGSVWAVFLSRAGHQVTVVDVAPPVVEAIRAQGLKLLRAPLADAPLEVEARPGAATTGAGLGRAEVVFFFVKAHHMPGAIELARPLISEETTVVSLQNGWGNADLLAAHFRPEQLVVGVTYHSATVLAPGVVAHPGTGPSIVGPYLVAGSLARAQQIARLLQEAGLETTAREDVRSEIWKKLILNAATLPTSALTGLPAGQLAEPGPLLDLVAAVTAEAVTVARALGYQIDYAERFERICAVLQGAGAARSSMLQDVQARRKTEIEVINGAVVRAAEQLGLEVPLNRALVALIGGLERSWQL
ncbi:ketopantoate reductase family protein [Thermogemmatispora sp.]|uniref:ketopantoate reductase family protein n=1 Tax=Thermogemmatispora sp. TaxID=1968838 RepID=UPI0035E45ADB